MKSLEWLDGHVTRLELLYIIAIIKSRLNSGHHFLEIGTFDGNTALNICHNLPERSKLWVQLKVLVLEIVEGCVGDFFEEGEERSRQIEKDSVKVHGKS